MQTNSHPINTIFFCTGCLISPVSQDWELCRRCQEQNATRESIERDRNHRNLIVFVAALVVGFIVVMTTMSFFKVN
jgi:hypothetical protein